jgi:molybdate-binding protein
VDDTRVPVAAEVAADETSAGGAPARPPDRRVVLAQVSGRWVAHRLPGGSPTSFTTAADGVLSARAAADATSARVALLGDADVARQTLLCAGCAPAVGILAARASAGPGAARVVWLDRSSAAALDLLARGHVHVAGTHLYDEGLDEFNVPFVQRRLPGRPMLIFNLARWETGLVVASGNPRHIRGVRDLARRDVAFVRRQAGAAAQDLVERLLRRERLPASMAARAAAAAGGHAEVARLVGLGVADAGIALAAVARAHGLGFIPLAEERFDLVLPRELAGDPRVARLLDELGSRAFRREMESLGGHVTRDAGKLIAETCPDGAGPDVVGAKGDAS